jgi:transcriptional regulator with XRE-family HTH domain
LNSVDVDRFSAHPLKEVSETMKMREFGVRLTQFREKRKLSITELARSVGVDYMQISRYEKGQSLPSLDTAVRISNVLEVSLDLLATGTEAVPIRNAQLFQRMRELDELPPKRQELASRILDVVVTGDLDGLAKHL